MIRTRREVERIEINSYECRELRKDLLAYASDKVLKRLEPHLPGKSKTNQANYRGGIRMLIEWAKGAEESLLTPSNKFGRRYLGFLMEKYGNRRATVATRLTHAHTLFCILQKQGCVIPDRCNPFRTIDFAEVWHAKPSNPDSK